MNESNMNAGHVRMHTKKTDTQIILIPQLRGFFF